MSGSGKSARLTRVSTISRKYRCSTAQGASGEAVDQPAVDRLVGGPSVTLGPLQQHKKYELA